MKPEAIKKIEAVLFVSDEEAEKHLTPFEMERRKRWVYCISRKMENPMISDRSLVDTLMLGMNGQFTPVVQSTAYRDLGIVTKLVGNIQLAAKNWYRYMIIEGAKKAYDIALTKEDPTAMAVALDKIGKYTMADKPDIDFDWDRMTPPVLEPSNDTSLLEGIEPIENLEERRKELRNMFKSNLQTFAEDVEPE